jgi:hypothetical protein
MRGKEGESEEVEERCAFVPLPRRERTQATIKQELV